MVFGQLKDAYKEKRGFIIATGPSLAYKDLSFLKDEITIGVNLSSLTLDLFDIEPTFNIVADKFQYLSFKEAYSKLTYGTKTKKIIVGSACETFPEELKDKQTYFFPKKLPQEIPTFSKDPIANGFARGKTVVFDAVQLAFYLGFSEVYILGMDLNTQVEWGKSGHSYEIHRNPRFNNLRFYNSESHEIKRGLSGNPDFLEFIEGCMSLAKEEFSKANRRIYIDKRSQLQTLEKIDILNKIGGAKRIVAIVPAKGTSTRVPNKNAKIFAGKPLFLHVLDTLLKCNTIDEVYLDTESEENIKLAEGRKHKIFKRDPSLATNSTDGNLLLLNESSYIYADIYVQALPTAPFLSQESIDEAVFSLIRSKQHDSVVGVRKEKLYLWNEQETPLNYNPQHIPNSIDLQSTIIETMSLYIIRRDVLLKRKMRIGERPLLFSLPLLEAFDINTLEEFTLGDIIMKGLKND